MLGARPASIAETVQGRPVSRSTGSALTVSPSQAFSPTTTGNSESSTRLRSGGACFARYCFTSLLPLSSSLPMRRRTVCVRGGPASFSADIASSACTIGPLSSAAPRPHTRPSRTTPAKGGTVQAFSSTGCTSPCTMSPSTGAPGGPGSSISVTAPASRAVSPSAPAVRSSQSFCAA